MPIYIKIYMEKKYISCWYQCQHCVDWYSSNDSATIAYCMNFSVHKNEPSAGSGYWFEPYPWITRLECVGLGQKNSLKICCNCWNQSLILTFCVGKLGLIFLFFYFLFFLGGGYICKFVTEDQSIYHWWHRTTTETKWNNHTQWNACLSGYTKETVLGWGSDWAAFIS